MSVALWDDVSTARYYEEFTRRHRRYQEANAALAEQAMLFTGANVLDVGAGTGLTAEAVLPRIGASGRVVCVEPAAAMRMSGMARLRDPRVTWSPSWPANVVVDRVLCGAAIWQMPIAETCFSAYRHVSAGGAFAFNMPSLYVGIADEPGGGEDPLLLKLASLIPHETRIDSDTPPLTIGDLEDALLVAGFRRLQRWSFRVRLEQDALRDWFKLPVINRAWLGERPVEEREAIIDRAYERTDAASWRWEGWLGWTAWK